MWIIKTPFGYVAQHQGPPQSNRRVIYTPERPSARHYWTEGGAVRAAKRLRVFEPWCAISSDA